MWTICGYDIDRMGIPVTALAFLWVGMIALGTDSFVQNVVLFWILSVALPPYPLQGPYNMTEADKYSLGNNRTVEEFDKWTVLLSSS